MCKTNKTDRSHTIKTVNLSMLLLFVLHYFTFFSYVYNRIKYIELSTYCLTNTHESNTICGQHIWKPVLCIRHNNHVIVDLHFECLFCVVLYFALICLKIFIILDRGGCGCLLFEYVFGRSVVGKIKQASSSEFSFAHYNDDGI